MEQYYYTEPLEAKYIRQTNKKLLDVFFYELERLRQNQYILTADAKGIEEFEKQFSIIPNPSTEDIEFRRLRLINRNTTKPPFTLEYLEQKLDGLLDGGYKVDMDYPNYALNLELGLDDARLYSEIAVTVGSIKPANIIDHLSWVRQLEKCTMHVGAALQTGSEMRIYPIFGDELRATCTMPLVVYYKQGTSLSVYPKGVI